MVFRTAFSEIDLLALPSEEAERSVGTADWETACWGVGNAEGRKGVEGERSFVGLDVAVGPAVSMATTGRLFLGLLGGRGGRAVLGGSTAGRDETGMDVATTAADMLGNCGPDSNLLLRPEVRCLDNKQTVYLSLTNPTPTPST